MRSAIVGRVSDRNPMEIADDLGHRFGDYFRMADNPSAWSGDVGAVRMPISGLLIRMGELQNDDFAS